MTPFVRLAPAKPVRWSLAGLFFLFVALPRLTQAQCPSGDVTLTTQDQVDKFPAGCTNFPSILAVSGGDITNLNGLRNLQTVAGDLQISNNPALTSIAGLTALTTVSGTLRILNNTQLPNLNGLNNLQSVGNGVNGDFQLVGNSILTSIAALTALTRVASTLRIQNNAQLPNLNGLNNLQSVGRDIQLVNNAVLAVCATPAICQLIASKSPDNLRISGNAPGCSSLQEVQDNCNPQPLAITTQPPSASSVCVGTTVTATVSTTGTVRAYQWYQNGRALTSQTSATLTLPSTTTADAGSYVVVVSNSVSSLTSTAFSLTVTPQSPDYQPLADLYNATNGPGWTNKTNWLTSCTPCGWYGVRCDGNGRVTELNLTNNQVSGSLPASLSALTNLQFLDLSRNQLSGSIPTSFSALTKLGILNLSYNQLSGSLPAGLSALTHLTFLSLANNQLSGSLPAGLSALTDLRSLELGNNQFSGSLPVNLSTLTLLQNLYLNNNQFSGSLPAGLSALKSLQYLVLNNNQFSGSIPAGLSALTNLQVLNLSSNQLSGCFPASLSALCGKTVSFNNNPGLPGGGDFGAFCASGAGSDAFRPLATASPNPVCANSSLSLSVTAGAAYGWSGPAGFTSTAQNPTLTATTSGLYSVTVGNGSPTCTATASVSVTVNARPTPTIVGLASSFCQQDGSVQLTATPAGGVFSLDATPTTMVTPTSLSVGQHTVVYSYTNASGCSATTSQTLTVKPTPQPPRIATQAGQPYAGGVSSLTISQNVGPVSLTVSGCSGGMLLANGNAASSFTVSTAMTGTQTYTATCTQNGCPGPAGSFQLTVVPTTLSVLYRDADYGQLTNNSIKPYLELANAGGGSIPYSDITVRYWFTSEGNAPPTNLAVYYAQLGSVTMNYVALVQPRQGALGYVEYSFPGGGSLGAGSNSGPIENGIQKTDGSNFDESDDYSYQANYSDYSPNAHITAYRKGADGVPMIFFGQEPTTISAQPAVQIYSAAKDSPTTSQIQTRVELRNTGTGPLPVANLKLRYYFTSDNNQTASAYVDYADIGAQNIAAQVVRTSTVNGADSYVELSFPGSSLTVNALSSLGAIDFRLVRSDYGLFDQSNDYSYLANYGNVGLNSNITAYLGTTRIFGTPPAAGLRAISVEPSSVLQARVLGNPVVGSSAEVEIRGATGQSVSLRLVDLQGRALHEQRIEQAGEVERVSLELDQSRGPLLLRVSTAHQQQSLKLLRP